MDRSKIWTTELVEDARRKLQNGEEVDLSCFCVHDMNLRRANINFKYTPEEQQEIVRCANDIIYYADKYAYSMTDDGIQKITLRPYQRRMLRTFQDNRWIILLASRQVGKCSIFNTNVTLINKNGDEYVEKSVKLGLLYYTVLSDRRKLTFLEKIIFSLYKLYAWLD